MFSVLVVDDHMELRLIFTRCLRDAGFAVTTATNGEEALTAVDRDRPNLILLDVFMPVMNGAQFLEQFRKGPNHATTPVLLMSAVPDSPEVQYAMTLGISRFMRKGDFSLDQLVEVVREVLPKKISPPTLGNSDHAN